MELLFKSINVRELLSTTTAGAGAGADVDDESSPLSAPDLRLLIHQLDSHSHQIKSKVHNFILTHHSHFSHLLSISTSSFSHSVSLTNQLNDLFTLLSSSSSSSSEPADVEIGAILREIKSALFDLESKRVEARVLKIVVGLCEKLRDLKGLIEIGEVHEAAVRVRVLRKGLRIGEEEDGEKDIVAYQLLRNEWFSCFDQIQDMLVKFMDNAVRFVHDSSHIQVAYRSSVGGKKEIELQTVLKAMDVLGILDYGLAKTADLFIKHAIGPAVNMNSPASVVVESDGSLKESGVAILKINPNCGSKTEDMDGKTLFSRMTAVVRFIYQFVCLENGPWMRCFGKLTWPRMSELIISNFLSKVVPDDASKLADFQRVINTCSEFETVLKEFMFISESDKNDERLSTFADNVEVHFAVRRKTEILAKARQLILQCNFTIPQEYGGKAPNGTIDGNDCVVDLLLSSERCVVSEAALHLMKLVHHTLGDVCLSSPRVALEFYHAARDALLIYEAIIPVKLERQLDSINQAPVLMHNDCLYLSQEILGLSFQYRPDFPSSIKEHAIFVDIAPRLQLLAEEILQKHVRVIIVSLKEAVDGADGYQNTHQIPQYESAKFSIERIVFILEKVRIIWEPVLLPSTYKRSMCSALESVFSRITQDILLLDDIDAEETLQLQSLIQLLLESLEPLLESLKTIKVDKNSDQCFSRPLEADIPSLGKIQKLCELLDMPLKSITEAWENGDLYGCGFILIEVVDFIKAIFTDSPLRRDCLARIYRINF